MNSQHEISQNEKNTKELKEDLRDMIEIRNRRTRKGLTQEQIADSLGVKPNTVSQWESGVREPRLIQVVKLAELFGCTVDELLGIEKTPIHNERA